jgi:hypothetical protein
MSSIGCRQRADLYRHRADLYRQRAIACYSLADGFSNPDQRNAMRLLAICWLHLEEAREKASEKAHEASQLDPANIGRPLRSPHSNF